MTTWQIKVEVKQGLHKSGTKFYRGIFVFGLAQLGIGKSTARYPIASMTSWAGAKVGWKENYDLGQMTLDSIDTDIRQPNAAVILHESWLRGELDRKRKDGYDIGQLSSSHVIDGGWTVANRELIRLIGEKRTEPIWDRVTLLKSELEREGVFYGGDFSATAVNIQAASEQSEGWGSW